MAARLHHRGPDARGVWADGPAGIALGHARLSILDLSLAGAQPMASPSGRYVMVFNGEIYNHLDLRRELETAGAASIWRGHSDTETLLALIDNFGVAVTLERAAGMFALAIWDRRERTLTLARDRMGEKPLYYGWSGGAFLFGSELKALMAFPGFANELDGSAIAAVLRYGYVPDPASIFRNVFKLPPGFVLTLDKAAERHEPIRYWSLPEAVERGCGGRLQDDYRTLVGRVDSCLTGVVKSQMLSDVPLGCFHSGGIDSSLTAALMQKVAGAPVRTFSIGFEDARFNEAPHARRVAEHLGTQHTEFIVTEADALALIPELPAIYDEPFADSSQIPTVLLSRLTRQHVTVALSGDGGDEVFGGYNRHVLAPKLQRWAGNLPAPARRALGRLVASLQGLGTSESSRLQRLTQRTRLPVTIVDKLSRLGAALQRADDLQRLYGVLVTTGADPAGLLLSPELAAEPIRLSATAVSLAPAEWIMAMDALGYLPGDILVKVDRAAMSASLETRAPFLDRRVVELAWQLPLSVKIYKGAGKRVLRDVLDRYIPRHILERPKQGFAIPLDRWLRCELRDWAGDLLSPRSLARTGVFDEKAVGRLWEAHQEGRDNAGGQLWSVLMLQTWLGWRHAQSLRRAESQVSL